MHACRVFGPVESIAGVFCRVGKTFFVQFGVIQHFTSGFPHATMAPIQNDPCSQ